MDRAKKRIIQYMRAEKGTQKNKMGLQGIISSIQGLERAVEKKEVGLESVLFDG